MANFDVAERAAAVFMFGAIFLVAGMQLVVKLAAQEEVNVDDVGVGGAKRFFEAKARILEVGDAAYRAFEDRKREEEDRKKRQEEFKKKREQFQAAA